MPSAQPRPPQAAARAIRCWRADPRLALAVAASTAAVHLICRVAAASRGFICSATPGAPWGAVCIATSAAAALALVVLALAIGEAMERAHG